MSPDAVTNRLERIALAPALIVGAPRSGTTRLQRILLCDARCAGGQESHFFATFGGALREFDRKWRSSRPHGLAAYWRREELVAELRGLWTRMASPILAARPDAERFVEKTPDHALWLDVVREVLPEARVVHLVRDSRGVVASLLAAGRAPWGAMWAPKSLDAAIGVWVRHVEAALAQAPDAPIVRHEDLAREPVSALRPVFRHLGLDADDAMLAAFVAAEPDARLVGAGEIVETPPEPDGFHRPGAADRWRNELGVLARRRIWRATATLMERLGYREDGSVASP